ncbi:transposase [Streptomyces sp. NPDC006530]|uniref:transposase n=1 Tax=Streptomyces sp. NPDC006530 TaxID=3364750 RepID=UPI0036A52748
MRGGHGWSRCRRAGKKPGRPPIWTRRQLIDGIRWRTRTATPWRDVPERYGPWDRVYDLFRRWQRNGTWKWTLGQLQTEADAKGLITWDVSVDSPVCRAHQHAAGARKKGTPERASRRHRHRAGRPRPGAVPRRADHEDSPRH